MRALHVGTRLAGTDGVSLEASKVARVLAERGFERIDLAGEVGTADVGHGGLDGQAPPDPQIQVVERRCRDPQAHLTGSRLGNRAILDDDDRPDADDEEDADEEPQR